MATTVNELSVPGPAAVSAAYEVWAAGSGISTGWGAGQWFSSEVTASGSAWPGGRCARCRDDVGAGCARRGVCLGEGVLWRPG